MSLSADIVSETKKGDLGKAIHVKCKTRQPSGPLYLLAICMLAAVREPNEQTITIMANWSAWMMMMIIIIIR